MTNKVEDISLYRFNSSDELFIDANIWIDIDGDSFKKPKTWRTAIYSQALKDILIAKSRIYIDAMIVSEFINTCARFEWNISKPQTETFKKFRDSMEFKPIAEKIAASVRRIVRHCTPINSGFDSIDIEALLKEFSLGHSDFNDQILCALCERKGFKLITHDTDFKNRGIPLITANYKLLH